MTRHEKGHPVTLIDDLAPSQEVEVLDREAPIIHAACDHDRTRRYALAWVSDERVQRVDMRDALAQAEVIHVALLPVAVRAGDLVEDRRFSSTTCFCPT